MTVYLDYILPMLYALIELTVGSPKVIALGDNLCYGLTGCYCFKPTHMCLCMRKVQKSFLYTDEVMTDTIKHLLKLLLYWE